ncbi:MAG TPA: hypothetical protein PLP05_03950 [Sedimentisphaerales bacterium]|nr:hypothetical protein [Sedimentisphaerales bacterium]
MYISDAVDSFKNNLLSENCNVTSITLDKRSFSRFKYQCELHKLVNFTLLQKCPRESFMFNGIKIVCSEDEPETIPELKQRPEPKVCSHKNWSVQDSCMLGRVKCLDCGQEISMVTAFNNLKNDMEEVISLITNR